MRHLLSFLSSSTPRNLLLASASGILLTGTVAAALPPKQLLIQTRCATLRIDKIEFKTADDRNALGVHLRVYQYHNCPFCSKLRAFLEYFGFSYELVEVNPLNKKQIGFSVYKKVPIVTFDHGGTIQLNDSSLIISFLQSHQLNPQESFESLQNFYHSTLVEEGKRKGREVLCPNKYRLMLPEKGAKVHAESLKEEMEWRQWVDDKFVHLISPNVYRNLNEAFEAFRWFSEVSDWDKVFQPWERLMIIYAGATVMFFVSKRLQKKYNLKSNLRESLYEGCNEWLEAIGPNRPFLGGQQPNLADIAMYGALNSFEGCKAFRDLSENTKITAWFQAVKEQVENHAGMTKVFWCSVFVSIVSILVGCLLLPKWLNDPPLPEISDGYFGEGTWKRDNELVAPFRISVPDLELDDLRQRLERSIIPDSIEDAKHDYGLRGDVLTKIRNYWLNEYDWRKAEENLNAFNHYQTEIEGLSIHFIHQKPPRGKYNHVYPILLVHGWPSSFFEYAKLIKILTDPLSEGLESDSSKAIAFQVVVPSLPGYAFSQAPKKRGCGTLATARIFAKLMDRLNLKRYILQGTDWGSVVTTTMAQLYPDRIIGLHLNMVVVIPYIYPKLWPKLLYNVAANILFKPKKDSLTNNLPSISFFSKSTMTTEMGYMHIQATKPDSIGIAMIDSPMGLAAYILEKYSSWSHKDYTNRPMGGLAEFTMDELITQVMIYWITKCTPSSMRYYKEFFDNKNHSVLLRAPVYTPTAVAAFANELLIYPRNFAEQKYKNLIHYSEFDNGGHFAIMEKPRLFATELINFARKLKT
ncbi:epoxide hydrolase 1 [Trichuris trichiura]|uniref:Prostaglandin E synthase 2 n=1 Tax=Trichuris trichiura TaxID=36087 RepID=A0A077Z1W4_TRITR|nr:epoxide hydrolase 1 [Trichuris trichiura]